MKYLLLFTLLLLLSCKSNNADNTLLKNRKLYTHLEYHKSGIEFNLKGPVKEVRFSTYFVDGSPDEFRVEEKDTIESFKEAQLFQFNRDGFLVYREDGRGFNRYSKNRAVLGTTISYDAEGIVSTLALETHRISLKNPKDTTEGKSQKKIVSFYGDSVKTTEDSHEGKLLEWGVLSVDDSHYKCTYRNLKTGKELTKVTYFKCEDGLYRMTEFFMGGTLLQRIEHIFENSIRTKQLITSFGLKGDTTIHEQYVNRAGDFIRMDDPGAALGNSDVENYDFVYKYDKEGNWTEKVTFINDTAITAIRREIRYY